MIATFLLLVLGLVLLYGGAEGLVRGSSSLALRLGLSPLVVGLTVVAFGTSAPELMVSLRAAYLGQGDISVGNVVGSNICNIGLILGFSALIVPIKVASQIVRIDTPVMIAVTGLALLFLRDGGLSRAEGFVLFSLLVVYVVFSVVMAKRQGADPLAAEFGEEIRVSKRGVAVDLLLVSGGLVLLVLGAQSLVGAAIDIAGSAGLSEAVIGLTIVALGTSLPEFATSLVAALKKEADIAVGNIVGSSIFNLLGILGLSAGITPLTSAGITAVDLWVMGGFAVVLWIFSWTGFRITRTEGLVLLVAYFGYIAWLVTQS